MDIVNKEPKAKREETNKHREIMHHQLCDVKNV
jgi:hypothetical protein